MIEVATCSHRTTRGYSFAAVIADECAFWRNESSANPDVEVIAAIRPGARTPLTAAAEYGGRSSGPISKGTWRGTSCRLCPTYGTSPSLIRAAAAPTAARSPSHTRTRPPAT